MELRSVALPGETRVRVALRHVEGLQSVLDHEIAYSNVAKVAQSGASSVRRSSLNYTGPGLDIRPVFVVIRLDVADRDVFKNFELVLELADAAKCYAS